MFKINVKMKRREMPISVVGGSGIPPKHPLIKTWLYQKIIMKIHETYSIPIKDRSLASIFNLHLSVASPYTLHPTPYTSLHRIVFT